MIKRHSILGPIMAAALALGLSAPAQAAPPVPGDFDYYVLALSWTPSWCATDGARRDTPPEQCAPDRDLGFTLHGLWPQYADGGWPEYCDTPTRDPSRGDSQKMRGIMGSPGLAWYEWKKHGRCSGLTSRAYYDLARQAYSSIARPDLSSAPQNAQQIEQAFLAANPALRPDNLIVTCGGGMVQEVRLCLTRDLAPMACAPDVLADACRAGQPLRIPPIP